MEGQAETAGPSAGSLSDHFSSWLKLGHLLLSKAQQNVHIAAVDAHFSAMVVAGVEAGMEEGGAGSL